MGDAIMETLLQDIRFGVRMLGKHGAFTFVALLTLALGIGANTAIFSVVNAIVFRPLPYSAPQQLVGVWTKDLKRPGSQYPASMPTFRDWQQQSHLFSGFAAYAFNRFHVSGNEGPDETRGVFTTTNFFDVMGVKPVLGRSLQPADERERVVGRLREEVRQEQAQAEMNTIAERLAKDYPDSNAGTGVVLVPLRTQMIGNYQKALVVLLVAVGFILLIACANVANLMMARTAARDREIAIRRAMGAGQL